MNENNTCKNACMSELTLINKDNMYLKKYPSLQFFEIYFDTDTYDSIERDVKVISNFLSML